MPGSRGLAGQDPALLMQRQASALAHTLLQVDGGPDVSRDRGEQPLLPGLQRFAIRHVDQQDAEALLLIPHGKGHEAAPPAGGQVQLVHVRSIHVRARAAASLRAGARRDRVAAGGDEDAAGTALFIAKAQRARPDLEVFLQVAQDLAQQGRRDRGLV